MVSCRAVEFGESVLGEQLPLGKNQPEHRVSPPPAVKTPTLLPEGPRDNTAGGSGHAAARGGWRVCVTVVTVGRKPLAVYLGLGQLGALALNCQIGAR